MLYVYKNYILTPKFLFLTIGSFLICGISTNKELLFFSNSVDVSVWDSILYNFNLEKSLGFISLSDIKVIGVYLIILYLVINFIGHYLNETKYLSIIRIGSVKKYMVKLIASTYLIIFTYFFLGYIILILVNLNLGFIGGLSISSFSYYNVNYIYYILGLFIVSNLIMILFSNIIIIIALILKSFKVGYIITFGILVLGTIGITEYLVGSHIYFYKIVDQIGKIKYNYYFIYLIAILISLVLIVAIINKSKDFLLYDYEI